ncbi:conserved hypothetical protein [Culex quinquefasciatus]|uniref:Methyltransferase type 11 domain-containing protein n=1 Tax=Culex quinquefasciatus TaxID=7176 RepID=B0W2J3_CULQU|nr:conserved hypothetical protein [Culex quinquefasciatus]|eukprot:XP_001842912.1 conserved hypothetical protein [Culex quinquefasciatus]
MTLSKNAEKKLAKKIKRCQLMIAAETGLEFTGEISTENVVICNAGLSTGLQQEVLLEQVLSYGVSPEDVVFPAGKSYCYLRFRTVQDAREVCTQMNGLAPLGQDGSVLLMAFCKEFKEGLRDETDVERVPPGLILVEDFVDEGMERALLGLVDWEEEDERSSVAMDFRGAKGTHLSVDLPQRSLLIMSGESRYGWTHGITPRKMDTVRLNNSLTVRKRELRVSFTFRKLHDGPCRCQFPTLCDTFQSESQDRADRLKEKAAELELENVHKVYDEIAKHFSETRHSPWPRVESFIKSLPAGSVLLDVGCGNGKYLGLRPDLIPIGCDRSAELLKLCLERGHKVAQCDCLALPFPTASADACISIAVVHHLATEERRRQALSEMARVLRPGGRSLVYVWAKNQEANAKKSSYLRQNKHNNRPEKEDRVKVAEHYDGLLPVHTNRTQFQHQDLLVPWKLRDVERNEQETKVTFLRYYHVFEEGELAKICESIDGVTVVESYYDQGNWCQIYQLWQLRLHVDTLELELIDVQIRQNAVDAVQDRWLLLKLRLDLALVLQQILVLLRERSKLVVVANVQIDQRLQYLVVLGQFVVVHDLGFDQLDEAGDGLLVDV